MTTATSLRACQRSTSRIMAAAVERLRALRAPIDRREVLRDRRDRSVLSVLTDQGWTNSTYLHWSTMAQSHEISNTPSTTMTRVSRPIGLTGPQNHTDLQTKNGTESAEVRKALSWPGAPLFGVRFIIGRKMPESHQGMPQATDRRLHQTRSMRSRLHAQGAEQAP